MLRLFFFLVLILFIFGIIGVQFFKGVYWECLYDHINSSHIDQIQDMQQCMDFGGDWVRLDSNFDHIGFATLTMFKVSLTEGWLDIMYRGIDSQGAEMVPMRG